MRLWIELRDQLADSMNLLSSGEFEVSDLKVKFSVERHSGPSAVDGDVDTDTESIDDVLTAIFTVLQFPKFVRRWLNGAALMDITTWRTPSLVQLQDANKRPDFPTRISKNSEWLVDRFSSTYLDDWAEDSLKLEWRYMEGDVPLPCQPGEMGSRVVERNELAVRIANIATAKDAQSEHVGRITSAAIELVRDGRRKLAAAVLKPLLQTSWDDGEIHNNYGFCLLPDNVDGGLEALERAAVLGYDGTVNIANRVLALYWLGRPAAALALAEEAVDQRHRVEPVRTSYMWNYLLPRGESTVINQDSWIYLLGLATHVAREDGNPVLVQRWIAKQSVLSYQSEGN